jgi:PAS domain S-box-containing protein
MFRKPRILIVDDEYRMCDSLKFLLSQQDYEVHMATSGREALDLLSKIHFDVALLDIVMPGMDGHQLMHHINTLCPETSVIVLTGHASVESAVHALREGAYDYIRKPFEYDELLNTVQNALSQKRLKRENEVIHKQLARSEERYQFLVQNSPDIVFTLDTQGTFTFISNAAERILALVPEKILGKHFTIIVYEEDIEKAREIFNDTKSGDPPPEGNELRLKIFGKDSQHCGIGHLIFEMKTTGIYDKTPGEENTKYVGTLGVARDITQRKRLEARCQQAERMEALGILAGGVAHDFNNLLMGIQGRTSLMLLDTDSAHPHYEHLKGIEEYVESSAELTRQMLGFARGGKYELKSAEVNKIVEKTSQMFGRTRKEITIHRNLQKDLWTVEIDQGQIEQVLLNLYVNAWHAMPGGGDIYLETENIILNESHAKLLGLDSGRFIKIAVTDTGVGMDEATRKRIFEPFFTTREMGRGAGLGLASAYGIIENHGGAIEVSSAKGYGSAFAIYLPVSERELTLDDGRSEEVLKGKETILMVDDEEMILDVGKRMLNELGYVLLTAKSGQEAIEIYRGNANRIDLVILDMIMPEMDGGETFNKLREINPQVNVLLSSGYSVDGQASEILKRGCSGFIQKPFDLKKLSRKVREMLGNE